jgi:hypothetical protein
MLLVFMSVPGTRQPLLEPNELTDDGANDSRDSLKRPGLFGRGLGV